MFDVININHIDSGYKTKYGKAVRKINAGFRYVFHKNENYVSYFKTPVVKIPINYFCPG